jgi:flagellar biosynthetic protein FliR
MLLSEMVVFAGSLLSMNFSFTLANLMDPIYREETAILGQLMGWVTTLVLLGAGLHRTLLAAVMRSFQVVPVGTFVMRAEVGAQIAHMGGGIFLAGVQLASPVMAAALTVEITMALIGRLAPQLSSTVLSVPIKTIACYLVLIGSLVVWPRFLESHFAALLDSAERMVLAG